MDVNESVAEEIKVIEREVFKIWPAQVSCMICAPILCLFVF